MRAAPLVLIAAGLAVFGATAAFAVPPPAAACRCAGQSLAEWGRDPAFVALVGTAGPPAEHGVPIAVERWFAGSEPAATVLVDPAGLGGDGASCGAAPLVPGTAYVLGAPRDSLGRLQVHLCTPHAPLATADGAALVAEAERTFGEGETFAPERGPPSPSDAAADVLLFVVGVAGAVALSAGLLTVLTLAFRGPEDAA